MRKCSGHQKDIYIILWVAVTPIKLPQVCFMLEVKGVLQLSEDWILVVTVVIHCSVSEQGALDCIKIFCSSVEVS